MWKWRSNACDSKQRPVRGNDSFKYLGSQVAADGGCEKDAIHRMNEGLKCGAEKCAE